ncbi:MAG: hypothetical protein OQK12_13245 [Motiliproteus sp.]|nr:hypothetical protein [Motiliproteus sp.]MCW9054127.1 hypothetical protein [Motiliproteus sp.]
MPKSASRSPIPPQQRYLLAAILLGFATSLFAGEWEIKTDLKYTDGARSDITTYKNDSSFDKRKVKHKYSTKIETLLTYTEETTVPDLAYSLRAGHIYKRVKDTDLRLKEDGSVKKDETRT